MSEPRQYCTFTLGDQLFGIDVMSVQEVVRYQQMTEVPLAPGEIKGLINLRGRIVTAIDLRTRLEMPPRDGEELPQNIIVHGRHDADVVSLLVDEIGDVLYVDEDSFERAPDTLRGKWRELILGAYKLEKRLLLVLDVEQALNVQCELADVAE